MTKKTAAAAKEACRMTDNKENNHSQYNETADTQGHHHFTECRIHLFVIIILFIFIKIIIILFDVFLLHRAFFLYRLLHRLFFFPLFRFLHIGLFRFRTEVFTQ